VEYINASISELLPDDNRVVLGDGTELTYDHLIIATGTNPTPAETPGLETAESSLRRHSSRSEASGTRSTSCTSPPSTALSPSRWPPSTLARCSRIAAS
jgi:NADPH-dependent 2,4-dienoyl-CoA reductase/sulfur reductase-like enzyme